MSDDLLKEATRALQGETDSDGADGRFTRARVMASLHQSKVKRRTRLAFVLPLAACLAAGTAWAGATGRLPAVLHAITAAVTFDAKPTEPAQKSAPPLVKRAEAEAVATPPPAPEALPTPAPEPAPAPVAPVKEAPPLPTKPLPSVSGAFLDRDGDLYRLAHEAHFAGHDYARALPAWDAYLRAAPNGRLATEARYNRAICLLRLGRAEEARTALKPFALGAMGYRQREAQQLLSELAESR